MNTKNKKGNAPVSEELAAQTAEKVKDLQAAVKADGQNAQKTLQQGANGAQPSEIKQAEIKQGGKAAQSAAQSADELSVQKSEPDKAQAEGVQAADSKEGEQGVQSAQKVKLTPKQKCKKFFAELLDMLKGAAFAFIVMCVFSTTIILFYGTDDAAIKIIAIIGGEGLLIAAFIMFGRQNGAAALRKTMLNKAKRKLGKTDERLLFRTGEYAPYKGFIIGFLTTVPFIFLQLVNCFGDYKFITFMLEYACGWAVAPLNAIGGVAKPVYFVMIIFPIAIHGGFYIQGKFAEQKRQERISRAEDDRRSGKKKHYYEKNEYEKNMRYAVDMDAEGGKRSKKGGKRK